MKRIFWDRAPDVFEKREADVREEIGGYRDAKHRKNRDNRTDVSSKLTNRTTG